MVMRPRVPTPVSESTGAGRPGGTVGDHGHLAVVDRAPLAQTVAPGLGHGTTTASAASGGGLEHRPLVHGRRAQDRVGHEDRGSDEPLEDPTTASPSSPSKMPYSCCTITTSASARSAWHRRARSAPSSPSRMISTSAPRPRQTAGERGGERGDAAGRRRVGRDDRAAGDRMPGPAGRGSTGGPGACCSSSWLGRHAEPAWGDGQHVPSSPTRRITKGVRPRVPGSPPRRALVAWVRSTPPRSAASARSCASRCWP